MLTLFLTLGGSPGHWSCTAPHGSSRGPTCIPRTVGLASEARGDLERPALKAPVGRTAQSTRLVAVGRTLLSARSFPALLSLALPGEACSLPNSEMNPGGAAPVVGTEPRIPHSLDH